MEATLNGEKELRRMKLAEYERIVEDLTLPNPAYLSAVKNGRNTYYIPEHLEYYTLEQGKLRVPRGYAVPFPYDVVRDDRLVNPPVSYPPLRITLRDVQQRAVDAYLAGLAGREERGVIVLPTGTGKSITGLYLARELQQRVLVIVQKEDLLDGWTKDAKVVFGMKPWEVGMVRGKKFHLGREVTLTTIQTLSALPEERLEEMRGYFGMLIQDEMHHAAAASYDVLGTFPARFRVGLTATLMRNDGLERVFSLLFGGTCYRHEDTGGDENILPVTVRVRTAPTEWFPPKGKVLISDIRNAIRDCPRYNKMLAVDIAGEAKKGKSCIVFTHLKDHCDVIVSSLEREGIPRDFMQVYNGDSKMPKDEMKRRAEEREVLVTVATYAIATEGTNVKAWERGFLATTVGNEKDTIQAIGRCRRRTEGKDDCIVYDYRFPGIAGTGKHGFVRDRVYAKYRFAVEGKRERRRGAEIPRPPARPGSPGIRGRRGFPSR